MCRDENTKSSGAMTIESKTPDHSDGHLAKSHASTSDLAQWGTSTIYTM